MTAAILDQRVTRWRKLFGPAEQRLRAIALGGAAAGLTLVGSFLNFISFNHYPLVRAEVALVLLGLCALGLLLGLASALSQLTGRFTIPVLMAVLALDFNLDGYVPLLIGAALGVLALRFLRQGLILLFSVVIVTSLWNIATHEPTAGQSPMWRATPSTTDPGTGGQGLAGGTTKPDIAIVHVIMDEHIGVEGIPDSVPGGPEIRERLRQFYAGRGFRVFGGAYSEALHTVNAIPRALGLATPTAWQKNQQEGAIVRVNPYFDRLQAVGFEIEVAENDWLEYCEHPGVVACIARPAGQLVDVGDALPVTDRAKILAFRFIALSNVAEGFLSLYDVAAVLSRLAGLDMPTAQLAQRTNTSTLNGMATLHDTIDAARNIKPGQALFAHVLVPHYPYVFDSACKLLRVSDWLGRRSLAPWERRYTAYFDQVDCAMSKVGELVAAVAQSPAAGKTVIIVHGDHGSRIMRTEVVAENEHKATERDIIDGYATFFAVSAPGVEQGYDAGRYPLRLLLDMLVRSGFRSAVPEMPAGFTPTIAIEDSNWNPSHERSMQDSNWWNAAPDTHTD